MLAAAVISRNWVFCILYSPNDNAHENVQRNKNDTFVPIDVNKGESASVSVKFPFLMRNKQLGACREGGLGSVWGSCLSPPKDQALLGGGLAPLVLSPEDDGRLKFK